MFGDVESAVFLTDRVGEKVNDVHCGQTSLLKGFNIAQKTCLVYNVTGTFISHKTDP